MENYGRVQCEKSCGIQEIEGSSCLVEMEVKNII